MKSCKIRNRARSQTAPTVKSLKSSVVLFDKCENLVRDSLVDASEREHFRHVTLALEPHHRGTMTDTVLCFWTIQLAKIVVYGDRLRRHAVARTGINIQFAPGQSDCCPRRMESIKYCKHRRCGRRTCRAGCCGRLSAASTTTSCGAWRSTASTTSTAPAASRRCTAIPTPSAGSAT